MGNMSQRLTTFLLRCREPMLVAQTALDDIGRLEEEQNAIHQYGTSNPEFLLALASNKMEKLQAALDNRVSAPQTPIAARTTQLITAQLKAAQLNVDNLSTCVTNTLLIRDQMKQIRATQYSVDYQAKLYGLGGPTVTGASKTARKLTKLTKKAARANEAVLSLDADYTEYSDELLEHQEERAQALANRFDTDLVLPDIQIGDIVEAEYHQEHGVTAKYTRRS
ncbi:hypothetical protein [Bufonid herpesvirus 1]|uniref:hypothetical protein n=1 Tax=Bufonid herpesvirus 1 TaxID=2282206 RepID=UPI000EB77D9E|nr:hypothetical protein [Bufonid herpesvirus 1]AXF48591.1 hypothetical protein [Bufonid herpesvirus 1]